MMDAMSREGLTAVQRGMAARPDSMATLPTIDVPTLIVRGEEDAFIPAQETELIHKKISGSRLVAVPRSGHYTPLEQPEQFLKLLRPFLDGHKW
jgi:pimeloyl-ACP methyl ester carboxylesterase